MKKIIFLVLFALFQFTCFAQVRNYVCVVRPNYSDELINDMKEFIPRLEQFGIGDAEERINDYIEHGSSGSGFVYVGPDGKNYIITNRHVIADAKTSSVVFMDENGELTKTYSGLKILAASVEYDIAILAFPPNERPFTKSIAFSTNQLEDGDPVYTAGFPGLLGNPSWQFGSGFVTNPSVKVTELIKPELSTVIQHSAQIDAGNSGGPLLIKNERGKYEIAGINAWKITNRQDTNFSIPAETVRDFIKKSLAGEKTSSKSTEDAIAEQANNLQKILNKYYVSFEDLIDYISIDYVEAEGKAIYDYVYSKCQDARTKQSLKEIMIDYSPITGMRFAIGWYIYNEYHKNEIFRSGQRLSVSEDKLQQVIPVKYFDSDIWYTNFYLSNTNMYAKNEWIYTNGGWKLYSFKNTTKNHLDEKIARLNKKPEKHSKAKKEPVQRNIPSDKVFYTPNHVSISYGALLPLPQNEFAHLVDIDIKLSNLLALDLTGVINENLNPVLYYGQDYYRINSYEAFGGLQLQFPITRSTSIFMPFVSLQGGGTITSFEKLDFQPLAKADAGLRISSFFGSSNQNMFIEAAAEVKMDFVEFKPEIGGVVTFGFGL